MKQVDEFLHFMMENSQDERISIYKDVKYGHSNYYLSFDIDIDHEKKTPKWQKVYSGSMNIHIDNRNGCILIKSDASEIGYIVFESKELVSKWSKILEEHISERIIGNFIKMVDETFSKCSDKDIARDWKMKKIFKE